MLAQIEHLIRQAGFGSTARERSSVYLTEAEAAAIYASRQSMLKGETFLVCDAGGGTTDLNVLRVESTAQGRFELMPLCWTEGEAVGSTLIDWKVRTLIKERLVAIRGFLKGQGQGLGLGQGGGEEGEVDVDFLVSRMMADKFDTFKCSFGSSSMDVPKLFLPVPGLGPGLEFPAAGVEDSRIVITR